MLIYKPCPPRNPTACNPGIILLFALVIPSSQPPVLFLLSHFPISTFRVGHWTLDVFHFCFAFPPSSIFHLQSSFFSFQRFSLCVLVAPCSPLPAFPLAFISVDWRLKNAFFFHFSISVFQYFNFCLLSVCIRVNPWLKKLANIPIGDSILWRLGKHNPCLAFRG